MGKIMANVYDTVMYPLEKLFLTQKRRTLLKQATGHILDIGSGTGVNFPFFNPETTTVYAIEPDVETNSGRLPSQPPNRSIN